MQPTKTVQSMYICVNACHIKVQKNISPSPPLSVGYGLKRHRAPRVFGYVRITVHVMEDSKSHTHVGAFLTLMINSSRVTPLSNRLSIISSSPRHWSPQQVKPRL